MTPERMPQIEEIFHAACDLPLAEREGGLSKGCGCVDALSRLDADGVGAAWRAGDTPLTNIKMEV